jgi:hypothetical protein
MAWQGKWGASSSSPVAPRRQGKWSTPNSFNDNADACTVGTPQTSATARAQDLGAEVPVPRITARRAGANASVRYRFATLGQDVDTRPTTLLLDVVQAGAPDVAVARRMRVRRRDGTALLHLPVGRGPYIVSASAFTKHGSRSRIVRATLP